MYPPMSTQDDMSGLLKRRNLFDYPDEQQSIGLRPRDIQFPSPQPVEDPRATGLADIYDKITKMQTGPANKRYRDFLDNETPNRASFQPSKTQRLAAILAGIHDNVSRRGRGEGASLTQSMLEEPYNRAMSDYKIKAGRFKEAADVEEKEIGNRVKAYRDYIMDQANIAKEAEASRVNTARIGNYNSQIKARDADMMTKGWTPFENKITGNRMYQKMGPDGRVQTIDSGVKMDETPGEKTNRAVGLHSRTSSIDLGRQKAYFDFTDPKLLARSKAETDYREEKEINKEERAHFEWAARQKTNPQRQFAQRALALIQIGEEKPELRGSIDYNKYSTEDPTVIQLMNAKIAQMNEKLNGPKGNKATKPPKDPRIVKGSEDEE